MSAIRAELPPIEPATREGRFPLSFAQERLWFIDPLGPGIVIYNLHTALRLGGALDGAAGPLFRAALLRLGAGDYVLGAAGRGLGGGRP
ncbi:MAG TPA: hypothetical protein VEQ60_11590 [Longimicrobium sp.]|nr:hypothetical protein [Longimicrobium sp.]